MITLYLLLGMLPPEAAFGHLGCTVVTAAVLFVWYVVVADEIEDYYEDSIPYKVKENAVFALKLLLTAIFVVVVGWEVVLAPALVAAWKHRTVFWRVVLIANGRRGVDEAVDGSFFKRRDSHFLYI